MVECGAAREVLEEQFTAASAHVLRLLAGVEDDGFFWEPIAGC